MSTRAVLPRRAVAAGFTLVELLVTLVVVAVLAVVGLPALQSLVARNRLTADANRLLSALYLARSAAVERGRPVQVCASADGLHCGAGWDRGWIVAEADTGGAAGAVLRVFGPLHAPVVAEAGAPARLVFGPDGLLTAPAARPVRIGLALSNDADLRRYLVVGAGGSARVCDPAREAGCP